MLLRAQIGGRLGLGDSAWGAQPTLDRRVLGLATAT